jgi:hypothetical protein
VLHRRRYLTWSGALSQGRGVVVQRWQGFAWVGSTTTRVVCRCGPIGEFQMKIQRISRAIGGSRPVGRRAWRELVVPRSGMATLRRS